MHKFSKSYTQVINTPPKDFAAGAFWFLFFAFRGGGFKSFCPPVLKGVFRGRGGPEAPSLENVSVGGPASGNSSLEGHKTEEKIFNFLDFHLYATPSPPPRGVPGKASCIQFKRTIFARVIPKYPPLYGISRPTRAAAINTPCACACFRILEPPRDAAAGEPPRRRALQILRRPAWSFAAAVAAACFVFVF